MSDIKHSPLPWVLEKHNGFGKTNPDGDVYPFGYISELRGAIKSPVFELTPLFVGEHEANADFIIRASNSHYELIEALTDCRDHLQDIASGSHSGAFEHELVDAANLILAKAKGDSND